MAIFNSYVKLPEGTPAAFPALNSGNWKPPWQGFEIAREETVKFLDTFKALQTLSAVQVSISPRHTKTTNAKHHVQCRGNRVSTVVMVFLPVLDLTFKPILST
jgi:hypothetical protein